MSDTSKEQLTAIRNELYDNLPTGEGDKTWRLLQAIKQHLLKLDAYIAALSTSQEELEKELLNFSEVLHPWMGNETEPFLYQENEVKEYIKKTLRKYSAPVQETDEGKDSGVEQKKDWKIDNLTHDEVFDLYHTVKDKIGTLGYNTFIHSKEVEEYRAWLRNDKYKHRIEWFEKQYPNGLYYKTEDGSEYGVNILTKTFLAEADAAFASPNFDEPENSMKITAEITQEQKDFLELIVHGDAASSIGGKGLPLGNAVQWCIDACMRIEKLYGIDACYVAWHDIRLPENDLNPSESRIASLEAAEQKWISVEDEEKPEAWKALWVTIATNGKEPYPYYVEEANFYKDGQFCNYRHEPIANVKFWKYKTIPTPPSLSKDSKTDDSDRQNRGDTTWG